MTELNNLNAFERDIQEFSIKASFCRKPHQDQRRALYSESQKYTTDSNAEAFHERLSYASFVSQKHGFIYVETPKAAATAFKWLLAIIEDHAVDRVPCKPETSLNMCIHHRNVHPLPSINRFSDEDVRVMLRNLRTICVVRNPFARLFSAWASKIRQEEPGYQHICRTIAARAGASPGAQIEFQDFAEWVVDTNDRVAFDGHWRPQTELLCPDILHFTDVIKVESLSSDLQRFFDSIPSLKNYSAATLLASCYRNDSLPVNLRRVYDEALAKKVADFYEADFIRYGYDTDSWKSLNGKRKSYKELETAALQAVRERNRLIEVLAKKADRTPSTNQSQAVSRGSAESGSSLHRQKLNWSTASSLVKHAARICSSFIKKIARYRSRVSVIDPALRYHKNQ